MAADLAEAADALVDELADMELDEDLVHQATDDDGSGVRRRRPCRPLRRLPHRPPRLTGGGARPPRAQARPTKAGVARVGPLPRRQARSIPLAGRQMNFHPECWNNWHFECTVCP